MGQESEYMKLIKDFIHSMENSLNEKTNEKENDDQSQAITNPIYVKSRGRPPQKRYKSSLEQHSNHESNKISTSAISESSRAALSDASNKHPLSDESNKLDDSKRMKRCGRCKQYTTHNRRTCNADLSNLQ